MLTPSAGGARQQVDAWRRWRSGCSSSTSRGSARTRCGLPATGIHTGDVRRRVPPNR